MVFTWHDLPSWSRMWPISQSQRALPSADEKQSCWQPSEAQLRGTSLTKERLTRGRAAGCFQIHSFEAHTKLEAHAKQEKGWLEAELQTAFREAASRHILNKRKAYEGQDCWLLSDAQLRGTSWTEEKLTKSRATSCFQMYSFEAHPGTREKLTRSRAADSLQRVRFEAHPEQEKGWREEELLTDFRCTASRHILEQEEAWREEEQNMKPSLHSPFNTIGSWLQQQHTSWSICCNKRRD